MKTLRSLLIIAIVAVPLLAQTLSTTQPVSVPNGNNVSEGSTTTDRCTTTDTTSCNMIGLLKQNNFLMGTPTGQQTMANSNSVVIASNQSNFPVKVTDGTNFMPTMDAVGRPGFVKLTDGTNTAPTGDTMARAFFNKVVPFGDGTLKSGAVTSAMASTTSTSVIAGTGSNYLYVTQCTTSNASTTVSTDINLQDGSGGTTLYVLPAPAAATATTGGGGGAYTFPVPLKVPTVGNGLFAANVTTGSSTKISCSGYISTTSF